MRASAQPLSWGKRHLKRILTQVIDEKKQSFAQMCMAMCIARAEVEQRRSLPAENEKLRREVETLKNKLFTQRSSPPPMPPVVARARPGSRGYASTDMEMIEPVFSESSPLQRFSTPSKLAQAR